MVLFRRNFKNYTDEALFGVPKADREAAFGELYRRYHKRLLFFFWQMLNGDDEKAQDFLHDLFVKLIDKPYLFNRDKRFSTWVYTVATNMCRNEFRNQKIRRVVGRDPDLTRFGHDHNNAADQLDRQFFRQSLARELDQLKPDHKTVFILRFHEGLAIKEIADIMETSEGTVKSRLFYTLKKLGRGLAVYQPG